MSAARFKVKTQRGCLCISEGNRLSSEICRWHFNFILPIMPDKTALMSEDGAAFVYSFYRGIRYIKPLLKHQLVPENQYE